MMKLPKARTTDLVEQEIGDELMIYDLLTDKAYNLNNTSNIVYKAANGVTTFDELRRKHRFSDDLIYLALDELKRNNLVADESYSSPHAGESRREVIKKIGLTSMIALPVIAGLTAPQAAHAASVCQPGSPNSFGERNGAPVGDPFTRNNPNGTETCADYPKSDRDNLCNLIYANGCCSNRAESTNCTDLGTGRTSYDCICGA